jgi:hypothetical protein
MYMELAKRFFLNCNSGISPNKVRSLVAKHGQNILIGIDPGMKDYPDSDSLMTVKAVSAVGAKLHVYLVGPGMMSWSADERAQIKYLAKSVGINVLQSNWHNKWKTEGWKKKNFQQFQFYHSKYNAYSLEIDNIDSSYIENDPDETVKFYTELRDSLKKAGITTKLMIKNLDEDQLRSVIDAGFGLDFLCEFGMFEEGTGSPRKQIALCEKMGIKAITPINGITDTYNYGVVAEGVAYDL